MIRNTLGYQGNAFPSADMTVIADACATRSLTLMNVTVPASQVHAASLATLNYLFAKVQTTDAWIAEFEQLQHKESGLLFAR